MREEQHVADGGLVAEEHDHAVDAVADAARGRHAVLERAHVVVVVLHGLVVAGGLGLDLRGEAALLVDGVVELGERVGVLVAGDDQLEAVGQARVVVLALGERAHLDGVVAHEGGVDDVALAQLVVELEDELAGAPARSSHSSSGGRRARAGARRGCPCSTCSPTTSHTSSAMGAERQGLERSMVWPWYSMTSRPCPRPGAQALEQALGELLHALEVGVGAVGLHRGELGVVREVHALVAELAPQLEDALHAAHDAALEVQLGGDAQVAVLVERVEVRGEGLGVGAAERLLQDGGLDLEVALAPPCSDGWPR